MKNPCNVVRTVAREKRTNEIEALLKAGEYSVAQIASLVKVADSTSRNHINDLYDEGRVYVSRYEVDGSKMTILYRAGCEDDAPMPPGAWKHKNRESVEHQPVVIRRDPLVVALYGPAPQVAA